jgi:WS/DGAT/MGAT family acyltransferase
MAQSKVSDRLGPLDSLFLYIEKKEMPLHIGSVFVFDGPIPIDELRALIKTKLPLIPRYRQGVQFPPLNAGYPTWEYVPTFDINRHIQGIRIKPGTQAALEKAAGDIFSKIMDRSRPLWDLTVVDGLPKRRSALIARVHHCLVDGVAGVELLNLIFNQGQDKPFPPAKPFHPTPPLSPAASLADAVVSSYSHAVGRLLSLESAALNVAGGIAGELLQGSLGRTSRTATEMLRPVERFPFNAPAAGPRRVAWAEFPLDQIKDIKDARQVKVNDVFLMMLGGAVQRYMQLHRVRVERRLLRLMVPVNLRHPGDTQTGNKISLIPVNIPLDIAEPLELLASIHERTESLKHTHAAELMVLGGTLLSAIPVPAQAALVGLLSNNVPVLPFNMVCTNVPGPQAPLYLLGRKMLTYYPYVPIGDFMGICCAMVSYNGAVYFGLTGDSACAPDVDRLRDFLYETFDEVQRASGVVSTPLARTRRTKERAK